MGQAKARGDYEQRKAQAIARKEARLKKLNDERAEKGLEPVQEPPTVKEQAAHALNSIGIGQMAAIAAAASMSTTKRRGKQVGKTR